MFNKVFLIRKEPHDQIVEEQEDFELVLDEETQKQKVEDRSDVSFTLFTYFVDTQNEIEFEVKCTAQKGKGEEWIQTSVELADKEAFRQSLIKSYGLKEFDYETHDKFFNSYLRAAKNDMEELTKFYYLAHHQNYGIEVDVPLRLKEALIFEDKLITAFQSKNSDKSVLLIIDTENNVDVVNQSTLKQICKDNNCSADSTVTKLTDIATANFYLNKDSIIEESKSKQLNKLMVEVEQNPDQKRVRKLRQTKAA
ncbi:hypothetical protein BCU69_16590 [Vibrio cyclitrophicus]|uniref:hypothetical protein n=1 Tax=Vibrio cyclitrophicus TaxID=47951 RepID=UPI000C853A58|nr:hypothetical protein [Vibrio cyclitrophicus]PMH40113.1 hypothetical protein BCU69_16590 [Vibrio cyclitrophicus]